MNDAHGTYYSVAKCIALVGANECLLTCLLCWNHILLFHETALPGVGQSRSAEGWYKLLGALTTYTSE